jgi:4-aminobutyrate aminotransferase-like enzyme
MAGLELRTKSGEPATEASLQVMERLLARGIIVLPEGEHSNVISFTPPLIITSAELKRAARTLQEEVAAL